MPSQTMEAADNLFSDWEEVRDQQSGKLLFKIDRKRGLIQTRLSYWDETRRKRVSSLIVTDLVPFFRTL